MSLSSQPPAHAMSLAAEIERDRFVRLCRLGFEPEEHRLRDRQETLISHIDELLAAERHLTRERVWAERTRRASELTEQAYHAQLRATLPALRAVMLGGWLWKEAGALAGLLPLNAAQAWRWRLEADGQLTVMAPYHDSGHTPLLRPLHLAGLRLAIALGEGDLAQVADEIRIALTQSGTQAWTLPELSENTPHLPGSRDPQLLHDDNAVLACLAPPMNSALLIKTPEAMDLAASTEYLTTLRALRETTTELQLHREQIERRKPDWRADYDGLRNRSRVIGCYCASDSLTVMTESLRLGTPEMPFEVGAFEIALYPNTGTVHMINRSGRIQRCDHPHVLDGDPKRESFRPTIAALLDAGDLAEAVHACLEYLMTYLPSEAILPIGFWPPASSD